MEVNGAPELLCFPHSSEYLPLCSAEQRHSYRFVYYYYFESPLLTGSEFTYRRTMGHRRGGMLISTGLGTASSRVSTNESIWGGPKALYTLHDFQLSQTKDWHRETILAISVIVAPNRWSCVVQWERVKHGLFFFLRPKIAYDTAWSSHSVFAGMIHVYWPTNILINLLINQYIDYINYTFLNILLFIYLFYFS